MSEHSEWTISFVDLAGFTALTETHGDVSAADLVDRFVTLAKDSLSSGDRVVKSIGDAVMLASPNAAAGVALAARLIAQCAAVEQFPAARAGLHHGPVVMRNDDMFGSTVNIAARVTGYARANQALATAAVAAAARSLGIETTTLGPIQLRNVIESVDLFELDFGSDTDAVAIDPVCRMRVRRARSSVRLDHAGSTFWFCSLDCAGLFASTPERFVGNA